MMQFRFVVFLGAMGVAATLAACGSSPKKTVSPNGKVLSQDGGVEATGLPVGGDDPARGSDLAYVSVVVFNDLASPKCAELNATLDKLREKYPWDIVRIVEKHDPSPELASAKLAATAGQGVVATKGSEAFFAYRDALYKEKVVNPDTIRKSAYAAGLSAAEFDAGLERGIWTEKVEHDVQLAKLLGVAEAPATFVNGIFLNGVPTLDLLKDSVEVELAKAKVLEQSGVPRRGIYARAVTANFADPKTRPSAGSELEDPKALWKVPVLASPVRGKATALVTVVEFSEFDCVYCKQANETLNRVRLEYGDRVRIVWKDLPQPTHARSLAAAVYARAGRAQKGDAGFWDAHDKLFVATKLEDPDLELMAKTSSLDTKLAMAQVRAGAYRRDIDADADLADDVEVRATPQLFINGRRLVGAQPFEKLKVVMDEEVKKAEALVRGGVTASLLYDWIIKNGRTGEPLVKVVPPNPNAPFRGPDKAPVLVQEFGDFQSPECRRIEPALEELMKAYPRQVKIAWRDLPQQTHGDAPLAAEAAHEAMVEKSNDGFFKMYGKLFGNQTNLKREDLETYAKESSLDPAKLSRALDGHTYRSGLDAEAKVAADATITSAPTFVVGSYILQGTPSFAKLRKLVERVLAENPSLGPVKPGPATPGGKRPPSTPRDPDAAPVATGPVKFGYVDLVVGQGRAAKEGDTVTFHYRARLYSTNREFDSSYGRSPATVALVPGMLMKGQLIGISGMRVGGKRRITVPPDYAYGNHGSGSQIPPNEAVVFDVELVGVGNGGD